jgi:hypothetical protein
MKARATEIERHVPLKVALGHRSTLVGRVAICAGSR